MSSIQIQIKVCFFFGLPVSIENPLLPNLLNGCYIASPYVTLSIMDQGGRHYPID